MEKCNKCGSVISYNDSMAWKCTECGKAFKVNLSKLKKLQVLKDKPENTGKMLLKCPTCGNGIDNGNEKIACKCSTCGNVMMGKLRDFSSLQTDVNKSKIPTKHSDQSTLHDDTITQKNKSIRYNLIVLAIAVLIMLSGIIFIIIKPLKIAYFDKQYTDQLLSLLQQNIGGQEYIESIEIANIMKNDREVILNMNTDFGNLSREAKHKCLKEDVGEKIQGVYSNWIMNNDISNNDLCEYSPMTFSNIEIKIKCKEKIYKYGYYKKAENEVYDFVNEFLDYDGTSYKFASKEEENTCYKKTEENNDTSNDTDSSYVPFTNKTGTRTTKCYHVGCNNYIALSGDTHFCTTHAKNCGVCGCYIDEDAMFCPSCIIEAFTQ